MAIKSKYPRVSIADVSYMEFVYSNFEVYGDKTAIVDGYSGISYSYSQLDLLTKKCSSALRKRGFSTGDIIAVYCPNVPEYPIIFFAVTSFGGIVTTVNPLYTADEFAVQLVDSGCKGVFTVPELLQKSRKACAKARISGSKIFVIGESKGCETLSELLDEKIPQDDSICKKSTSSNVAFLPYSSGITGLPKGVLLSHQNLVAGCSIASVEGTFSIEESSIVLGSLPFFHSYSVMIVLSLTLYRGGKVICAPSLESEAILEMIRQHKITHVPLVPPIITTLIQNPKLAEFDLSSLVCLFSGGSKLLQETVTTLKKKLPHVIIKQGYGMTETSAVSHLKEEKDENRSGSVGLLLSNMECKVVCVENGETLQANKDGELCLRGPTVMQGYLNNPHATALAVDSEGWLHTGDIGYYDDDGYFYIVDRLKDLINCRGFQVSPQELEYVLLSHSDIEDAAVVGLPEVGEGEVPKAFVVKRNSELTDDDVVSFVSERVAPYKRLHGGVEFISKIPKSYSGKILRRLLKEGELGKLLNEYGNDESDNESEESVIEIYNLQHRCTLVRMKKSNVIIKPQDLETKSSASREKPKQFDSQKKSEIKTEKSNTVNVSENPVEIKTEKSITVNVSENPIEINTEKSNTVNVSENTVEIKTEKSNSVNVSENPVEIKTEKSNIVNVSENTVEIKTEKSNSVNVSENPVEIKTETSNTVNVSENPVEIKTETSNTVNVSENPVEIKTETSNTVNVSENPVEIKTEKSNTVNVSENTVEIKTEKSNTVNVSENPIEIKTENSNTASENSLLESTNSSDAKGSVKHVNENYTETPNQNQIVPTSRPQSTVIKSSRSCVLL